MIKQAGWVKHFSDGTPSEEGYDELVIAKKASWTRGKNDNIQMVELHTPLDFVIEFDRLTADVPRDFWQEDDMVSVASFEKTIPALYVARRVMQQIMPEDVGTIYTGDQKPIDESHIGKWYVVEVSFGKYTEVTAYIRDHK